MMNWIKTAIFLGMSVVLFTPSLAQAQGGFFGGGAQKIPSIQFERDNQYMADILSLQNQISLLSKLIDRQNQLNKMAENLSMLNMPFVPPAPEYEICEQLPANNLCTQFYSDLYGGREFSAAMPAALPVPTLPKVKYTAPTKNINELSGDVIEKLEEATFLWAEINCLNEKCRATVVSDLENNPARYTIRVGDKLPNGLVVESISVDGVVTSRGGKPVRLSPAPSSIKSTRSIS